MGYKLLGAVLLVLAQIASADITPEVLKFRTFANKEMDRHREATGAHGAASVRVRRAEYQLQLRTRLFASHAATNWDVSQANLELAKARVALGRATADIESSAAMEKVWRWFAEDGDTGSDHSVQIAEQLVVSRRAQQTAAQVCVDNIKTISFEVNYQHQSGLKLLAKAAISQEEVFNLEIAADEAGEMVTSAQEELQVANASLVEAQKDYDSVLAKHHH